MNRRPTGTRLGAAALAALAICLIACTYGDHAPRGSAPRAVRGVMDLRGIDLSRTVVGLDGEWAFYWGRLVGPRELAGQAPPPPNGYLTVPGIWNSPAAAALGASPRGCATYRLKLLLADSDARVVMLCQHLMTAHRLYVNGRLASEGGTIAAQRDDYRAAYAPLTMVEIPGRGAVDLVLQVAHFEDTLPAGGIWATQHIGPQEVLAARERPQLIFDVFIIASLLAIGLYHVALYLLRRSDPSSLWFALFCINFAVYSAALSINGILAIITGPLPWKSFAWLIIYIHLSAGPLFTLYLRALFPDEFKSRAVINIIVGVSAGCMAAMMLLPGFLIMPLNALYVVFMGVFMAYCIAALIRALRRRREGAVLVSAGYLIIILATVNEVLVMYQKVTSISFFPLAVLLYCAIQSFLLSRRFMRAFYRVERLSGELEEKNRRLLAVDRLKDEFLANTSHELRTPLNGIIGLAESLTAGAAGPLGEAARRNLAMIAASGRRLSALVNDILDFSKLKERTLDLRKKPVDLASAAAVVITVLRPTAERGGLDLRSTIPANLPPVWADENRLQQILYNLVGNAIKFTEAGGVTVGAEARGSRVVLTVTDTGIGIAPEDQERIFEAFEQADGSVSRSYGGTGLGLSITRRLVELHKGTIGLESEPGRGSRFTVDLPQAAAPAAEPLAATVVATPAVEPLTGVAPPPGAHGGDCILVVDDDLVNCQVLVNLLALEGYKVVSLPGGRETLDYLAAHEPPALILLDIMMPHLSGYEVARIVRQTHGATDLPIIMLTAKTQVTDLTAGFAAGANDYLTKPFDAIELVTRVGNHLALREAVRESRRTASLYRELELARAIQRTTIPERLPSLPGLDLAAAYIPMEMVGGDFYQFIPIDDHRLGIVIADVSGHGVPAAIIASMATVVIGLLAHQAHRPERFLAALNRTLSIHIGHQFLTVGFAIIDVEEGMLRYASAGHEPLLVLRHATGAVEPVVARGRPVGWFTESALRLSETAIAPGDRLVLYTDGVTEVFDAGRRMFGAEGLGAFMAGSADLAPDAFIDALVARLRAWSGSDTFDDDVTVVVAQVRAVSQGR